MRARVSLSRIKGILLASIAGVFAGCAPTFDVAKLEAVPESRPLIRQVVAHRGSLHNGLPDNSLPALTAAARAGIRFLEVDVRLGKDGRLFLFHDGSIKKKNSVAPKNLLGRPVQDLSTEERAQVRLDPGGAVSIPLLSDALRALRGTGSFLQLDLKAESDELVDAVIALLNRAGAFERVVIQVRGQNRVARVRSSAPTARVLARCKDERSLDNAIAHGVEFVELERWITGAALSKAHAAKIPILINVAGSQYDEPKMWGLLRSRGVDLIMTNHAIAAK